MPQSLVQNLIHLVYSTKNRQPWIIPDVQEELFAYQERIYQEWDSAVLALGGVEDHVHALFALSKNYPLIKIVEEVKKSSSKWIKTKSSSLNHFQWQTGYAAFSVSQSNLSRVKAYIHGQKDHHARMDYRGELRALLIKHGVSFDERYVWD